MSNYFHDCWICGQPKHLGQTMLGGNWVCDDCWKKVERPTVAVAGRQISEGVAAMWKDAEK